jgi:putative membrane protein
MGTWGTPMSGGYLAMNFAMLVLAAGAVAMLVILCAGVWRSHPVVIRRSTSVEELLADRYARGEIDEAEYHRRLDVLDRSRAR